MFLQRLGARVRWSWNALARHPRHAWRLLTRPSRVRLHGVWLALGDDATPAFRRALYAERYERGEARWSLPLGNTDEARFVYFDADGEPQDRWPPALGLQDELPQAIALVRESERGTEARVRIAAVHGPAHEHIELYQTEED